MSLSDGAMGLKSPVFNVSILVLMDESFRPRARINRSGDSIVSILVLMDESFRQLCPFCKGLTTAFPSLF